MLGQIQEVVLTVRPSIIDQIQLTVRLSVLDQNIYICRQLVYDTHVKCVVSLFSYFTQICNNFFRYCSSYDFYDK